MEHTRPHRVLSRPSAGFTLIELLVVLLIIFVVTLAVIRGQNAFSRSLLLTMTTYDIALTLRATETYGVSSRAIGGVDTVGYGLHFDLGDPKSYLLFADVYPTVGAGGNCHPQNNTPDTKAGNCVYDASYGERILDYRLNPSISIVDFCVKSSSWNCDISTMNLVFVRPNPSPAFISANGVYSSAYTSACITLTSVYGGFRYISLSPAGAINANATSCPLP